MLESIAAQLGGVMHAAHVIERMQALNDELARTNEVLEASARTDALTGVGNRRRFDQFLKEAGTRARKDDRPMAVLLADIDHFKAFNDGYGHPAGDVTLRCIARLLSAGLRDTPLRLAREKGSEGLTAAADAALYRAKRAGRNRVEVAPPSRS